MTKRLVTLVLSVTLLLATVLVAPETVLAQQEEYFPENWQAAERVILSAWDNYEDEADVSEFNIDLDDTDVFCDRLSSRNPEYFYVTVFNIGYSSASDYVLTVYFDYFYTQDKVVEMREKIEQKANSVLNSIPDNLADEEKLLFLYDYIASNNNYDFLVFSDYNENLKPEIRTVYGCLINNLSICEGIAQTLIYFCKRLDIECYAVGSDSMNHEWNMVKLGNNYYHIDITYASPGFEKDTEGGQFQPYGYISHDYFLISDKQIKSLDHKGWDIPFLATDSTTYEKAYWKNVFGQVGFVDGFAYFIRNGKLSRCNLSSGKITDLYSIPKCYFKSKDGYKRIWVPYTVTDDSEGSGFHTIFSFDYERNNLYFEMGNTAYSYNVNTKSIVSVYSLSKTGYILSLCYKNNRLYMTTNDINDKIKTEAFYFGEKSLSADKLPDYTGALFYAGDIDLNGKIGISDVLALKKYLAKAVAEISLENADINKDDVINLLDLARLKVIYMNMK